MSHARYLCLVIALSAFLAVPNSATAQDGSLEFPAASPPASVRDQIGVTTVEIEYGRPGVKGRTIFGDLVPYGEVWRTGANAATQITLDTDVTFGGQALKAGTYALFTIPGQQLWTVILNSATEQWGSYGHDPALDVVRVDVKSETLAEPVETMRLGIDHIRSDSAQLTFAWERSGFSVHIEVDLVAQLLPKINQAMGAPGEKKPYLAAAMFYYEHDLDLEQALAWINTALEKQPDAVWLQYRKGLIQAKAGDTAGAVASAEKALSLAQGIDGELGTEYSRLSEALLAKLDN
jgi:hypothetical protein